MFQNSAAQDDHMETSMRVLWEEYETNVDAAAETLEEANLADDADWGLSQDCGKLFVGLFGFL